MPNTAQGLVDELVGKVGLETVDAHRSAFTALACAEGWTKARIGRYLGISRARVGQKVDKLLFYATEREDVPVLTETMQKAVRTKASDRGWTDHVVQFKISDWDDPEFAQKLLQTISSPRTTAAS